MSTGKIINSKLAVRDGRLSCDCCVDKSCEAEIAADPFAFGACCFYNADADVWSCVTRHRCECALEGGVFQGVGSSCAVVRCDRSGADGPSGPSSGPTPTSECVHFYEAVIACQNGAEVTGPVNRASSQCEPCDSTGYPDGEWVRESRLQPDGRFLDYWVLKICSGQRCGRHIDCQLGGPSPFEIDFTNPPPRPDPAVQPVPQPGDYCYQYFPGVGPDADPAPYVPLYPNGSGSRVQARGGCSECNRDGSDLTL